MRLRFRRRRRDRTLTLSNAKIDAATRARKEAERRWPAVHEVTRELREQRERNHFADRVWHALEGR